MKLTDQDIERYAPYHTMPAFKRGFDDYNASYLQCPYSVDSVDGQAWDRGHECAMLQRRR